MKTNYTLFSFESKKFDVKLNYSGASHNMVMPFWNKGQIAHFAVQSLVVFTIYC